jgi:hypothetical protein
VNILIWFSHNCGKALSFCRRERHHESTELTIAPPVSWRDGASLMVERGRMLSRFNGRRRLAKGCLLFWQLSPPRTTFWLGGIMKSIADLLANYKGESIEVVTNASQSLAGTIQEVYDDYFVLLSTARIDFIPYTGISSLYLPSEIETQPRMENPRNKAFLSQTSAKQKAAKRTKT